MKKKKLIIGLLLSAFIASAAAQQLDNDTGSGEQPSLDADYDVENTSVSAPNTTAGTKQEAKKTNEGDNKGGPALGRIAGTKQAAKKTNKGDNKGKNKGKPALGRIAWKPMSSKPDCKKNPDKKYYPNKVDRSKFYECDLAGKAHERTCQKNYVYSGIKNTCYYDKELNVNKFDCAPGLKHKPPIRFHAHNKNWCKYIICDIGGKAYERNCVKGTKWNNKARKCESTNEACPSAAILNFNCQNGLSRKPKRYVHAHDENRCKYIVCDDNGMAKERTCAKGKRWSRQHENCVKMSSGESCHFDYASSGCTLQPAYLLVMIVLGICQMIRHM